MVYQDIVDYIVDDLEMSCEEAPSDGEIGLYMDGLENDIRAKLEEKRKELNE